MARVIFYVIVSYARTILRTSMLIGEDRVDMLSHKRVAVFGVGG